MSNPLFDLIVALNSAGLIPNRYSITSDKSLLLHYDRACVDIYEKDVVLLLEIDGVDNVYEFFIEDKEFVPRYIVDALKQHLIYDNI